jgi:hypothetical protein
MSKVLLWTGALLIVGGWFGGFTIVTPIVVGVGILVTLAGGFAARSLRGLALAAVIVVAGLLFPVPFNLGLRLAGLGPSQGGVQTPVAPSH